MDRLDCAVIGAGVVGLAIARQLALRGRHVVVLEAERAPGMHTSSRNSEVIHAGIYYPPGSAKAKFCVEGRRALYDYCEARGVPHRRIGKLLVAVRHEEVEVLERYKATAETNGVDDPAWVSREEAARLEPAVVCVRGLLSPSTGIIDSHALMQSFAADIRGAGGEIVCSSRVTRGAVGAQGIELEVDGADPSVFAFRTVVNSAGLFAQDVARTLAGLAPATIPAAHYAKGHYFTLAGRSPFQRLVYPIPEKGGLGVHVTLDLAGAARFGPDVTWTDRVDYEFDEKRADAFYRAIRAYYPALRDESLVPGFVGVRPKLEPDGSIARDFVIQGPEAHGVAGLVHLYGIESPGLTSCLAIAHEVARLLGG